MLAGDHDRVSPAADGWRATDGFTASSIWKNSTAEIVVILEREVTH